MTVLASGELRETLEARRLHAAAELGAALQEICCGAGAGDASARILELRQLKSNVYRVRIEANDAVRSLMLKSSNPALARHNQLVARRWLPAIGMTDAGARLEGSAADRRGERIWLIYEDLGDARLDVASARSRIAAVVDLIATLHTRSAGHAVLPDCRVHGGDLGAAYLSGNVRDAVRGLELLRPPRVLMTAAQRSVVDRLLARLRQVQHELPDRLLLLELGGGPEVLLHGDLWTTNAFALAGPAPGEWRARLIDWDHAGVGWASYDLSTFLLRFPREERPWILERYRAAVAPAGWQLPGTRELNALFETAEFARFANRAVWPAVELLVDGAAWAFDELEMVAGWFDAWQPVLPEIRVGLP